MERLTIQIQIHPTITTIEFNQSIYCCISIVNIETTKFNAIDVKSERLVVFGTASQENSAQMWLYIIAISVTSIDCLMIDIDFVIVFW
jgi:hypothetical protein